MNEREQTPAELPQQPPMYVPEATAPQPVPPTQPAPPVQSAPPAQSAPARPAPRRPAPRTSPIVWGALILAFCGYIAQRMLGTGELDLATWVAAITIGLGVLLLGVGAAVLIRNRRR
ncbi:hypothetical protein [Leucobacter chromiireducens]|uniref:hypothetical protein n=1 Tax=Leucobacter chromiireducens TaxID=283877 RepID=UPI003F81EBFC